MISMKIPNVLQIRQSNIRDDHRIVVVKEMLAIILKEEAVAKTKESQITTDQIATQEIILDLTNENIMI